MLDLTKFGKRLADARMNAGLSQTKVEESIGITRMTIGRYERGIASPSIDRLWDMARLYGCSIDWLCGVEDD